MNQIAQAAEFALSTCTKSSWKADPIRDYGDQRLAFDTMKAQLLDQAVRAQAKLFVMLIQWALTGTWPKFRNAPVYFLNGILRWVASQKSFPPEEEFPETPPPWEAKHAAHFFEGTALCWFSVEADVWAPELAAQEFHV